MSNKAKAVKLLQEAGYSPDEFIYQLLDFMNEDEFQNALKKSWETYPNLWPLILDDEGNLISNPNIEK